MVLLFNISYPSLTFGLTLYSRYGNICGLRCGVEQWQLVGLITRRSQVRVLPPLYNSKGTFGCLLCLTVCVQILSTANKFPLSHVFPLQGTFVRQRYRAVSSERFLPSFAGCSPPLVGRHLCGGLRSPGELDNRSDIFVEVPTRSINFRLSK